MNKQELIKAIETLDKLYGDKTYIVRDDVLKLVGQLDEPQKVQVPQFVAEWIEKIKKELSLREAMSQGYAPHEVDSWLRELDQDGACLNQELFARAWLDGYEVEKEKRYRVKMKGVNKSSTILKLDKILDSWYFGEDAEYSYTKDAHTRKELEKAGFRGVFDSPLFEVEEVE